MWQRRGTAAEWLAANPVLAAGEIGIELGTPLKMKLGDGSTVWAGLPYEGGPGSGSDGTVCLIDSIVTSGSAASITFASIPNNFRDLKIVLCGRDNDATVENAPVHIQCNGDNNAAHYSNSLYVQAYNGVVSSSTLAPTTDGLHIAYLPGTLTSARAVGEAEIRIPNYAGNVFDKIMRASGYTDPSNGGSDRPFDMRGGRWIDTSPISSLVLVTGTTFHDGTVASMYGYGKV